MVKKASKAQKKEEIGEVPENDTENGVEDTPNENGETTEKKKPAQKKTVAVKKSEKTKDDTENAVEDSANENGDTTEKKKSAPKKKVAVKKSKPTVEPERKSSRAPKPVIKEGQENESFEVEKVVDMRVVRGHKEFLVRWKGYSRGDDTWETESSLANCSDLLQKFTKDNPDAGKQKKRAASKSPSKSPKKKAKKAAPKKVEKNYEVENVVGMREIKGKREFKIRWKGYKESDDTWEPEKHLDCADLISKYMENHKEEDTKADKESSPKKSKVTPAKKQKKTPAKATRGKRAK